MLDSTNPYRSPQTTEAHALRVSSQDPSSHSKGLIAASVLVGGLATAVAIYLIYVKDPRTGVRAPKLEYTVMGATALSSAIWAVSGWLQRRGSIGLAMTFVVAAISAGLWIAFFGTYADVLGAAACIGWPCSGFVASVFVYRSGKLNHKRHLKTLDGG